MSNALALVAVWLLQAGSVPRAGGAALRGEVVFAGDETPLPGVAIEIESGGSAVTAATDPQGAYRIENLEPGAHVVRARLAGFDSQTQTVVLPESGLARLDFALRLAKWDDGMCCRVAGVVRDQQGRRVPGARVVFASVRGDDTVLEAEADARGRYSMLTDFHLTGEYLAFALVPESAPSVRAVSLGAGPGARETRVDFFLDRPAPRPSPNPRPSHSKEAAIHGQVLSLAGLPLTGATVTCMHEGTGRSVAVRADAGGSYRCGGLVAGDSHVVTVEAPGYVGERRERDPDRRVGWPVDFALLRALAADAGGSEVAGTVRGDSGQALDGAAVTLFAAFRPELRSRAYADVSGRFRLQVPQAGLYVAFAYLRGRAVSVQILSLDGLAPLTADFALPRR
jgi:hypothetical protein